MKNPGCVYVSVINTHNFGRFWSISSNITHHFGVLERFPRLTIPGMCLRVRRLGSKFWPILTRFIDYYSLFSGPRAISIVVEPQGALTCQSSKSQFWPILVRFMHYYSLLWGPGVISMIEEPWGALTCRSSTLAILSILTRFVDYYSPFWGPNVISMVVDPEGVLTC